VKAAIHQQKALWRAEYVRMGTGDLLAVHRNVGSRITPDGQGHHTNEVGLPVRETDEAAGGKRGVARGVQGQPLINFSGPTHGARELPRQLR
jgi:hypothetical protein